MTACNTSIYKSQGTVSCGIGSTGDTWINFVPHGDYLVKHEGKSYAAFLTNDGGGCILKPCKDEHGNPIKLEIKLDIGNNNRSLKCSDVKVSEMFIWAAVQSAAMTRSKVQVEVENGDRDKFKLTGITIPA